MRTEEVDPGTITVSKFNERTEDIEENSDDSPSLTDSVKEIGVVEPPKVRETNSEEFDYEVIVGQRRVNAAQQAGLESLPIIVGEWDDEEALTMSISENIDAFKETVSPTDRAEALETLWELMDEEGDPSPSKISNRIGVGKGTISTWLEPVKERWKDSKTTTEPVSQSDTFDNQTSQSSETIADKLGERKMSVIRNATDSQDESDEVAEKVYEEKLTQSEVKELRTHLEDGDDLDTAVEKVKQEDDDDVPSSFSDVADDEVDDVDDPTDIVDDEEEESSETPWQKQIEEIETKEVEIEEIRTLTVEIPEDIYERIENYASDFDYDSVEDYLRFLIPEYLESQDGTEEIIRILQTKVAKRGY